MVKRLAVVAQLAVGTFVLGAQSALAGPPAGSDATCPPMYQAMTLEMQIAQAQRLGIPESSARALFESVNKNEDDWICQTKLPGDETSYNFTDNQAVGRDRT